MAAQEEARQRLIGIGLLVLSASMFGAVDGISKILATEHSVAQIVWARYALGLVVLLGTTRPAALSTVLRTRRPMLQVMRGLTPLTISVAMVFAVRYLPLAEATVVLFAGPFLVVALSAPLLGEKVKAASWIGVIVGFIAVLIVARPGFGALSHYMIFPLVAAVFYAALQLITRSLAASGERSDTTLIWTLLVGAVASTPFAIIYWVPTDLDGWLLMLGLGIVFGFSQFFMIKAFSFAPAALLTPLSYVQIISATIFGMAVFGDVPDHWTILGIVMIIGAGVYVMRRRAS